MKDLLLAALLLAPLLELRAAQAGSKPYVILVLTDDQGYGDLSCTGNPILKTPSMDWLAAESVNFLNVHVDSYCTPTRSALMTGRYCHRVGGWGTINGRNMLRDEEVTKVNAGPTDIEATLLDEAGKALCSAFYVSVQESPRTKQ